ncbi:MAG: hypothetical protein WC055_03020 [Melioribacteraceae bacterium]
MKNIIKILLLLFSVIIISCDKSTTEPEARIKTPDEMSWTVDTLRPDGTAIQLMPRNFKAFSPKDIWLVCRSDVARGLLWHYDGKTWQESNIYGDLGGMRVDALDGSSSSDLWAVGYSGTKSFIGHYDGLKWRRYAEEFDDQLLDITKDDEGNLWACGRNGLILKYINGKWEKNYFKVNVNLEYNEAFFFINMIYYNKKIHLLGNKYGLRGETHYHIAGDFNSWNLMDSNRIADGSRKIGNYRLRNIDNKLYSCGVGGVWLYKDSYWEQIFFIPQQIYVMSGINRNYLLAVGPFNKFYFSEGDSWNQKAYKLNSFDEQTYFDLVWTNGFETFIAGEPNVGRYALVWHGK